MMKTQILQLNRPTAIACCQAGWQRVTFILLFLTFLSSASFAQIKQWDRTIGGGDLDGLGDLQRTRDGGYILGGNSFSGISGDKTQAPVGSGDYWIVKLDPEGNKLWDKTIGGSGYDELTSLYQTSDGGYILGGWSISPASGDKTEDAKGSYDYWVVKVDSTGNRQWDKTLGGNKVDFLFSLQQTKDGGYIVGGWSNSDISGDKTEVPRGIIDYWVLKLNADGEKEWDKTLGGNESDRLAALQQTSDGGYLLGGTTLSEVGGDKTAASKGSADFWLVKLDAAGNKRWDKALGGNQGETLTALEPARDGGFILGGNSGSGISGDKTEASRELLDYWVVKVDADGEKQWDKTLGGNFNDELHALVQAADGGYLVGGYSLSGVSGDKTEPTKSNCCCFECPGDFWVVKLDSAGQIKWDKTLGGEADDNIAALQATSDGAYIIGGTSATDTSEDKTEPSKGYSDIWVVKLRDEEPAQAPFFRTFAPQQGLPGSQVVLSGRYLTTTTDIFFNGAAAAFQVLSDTTVAATVPETATNGPITLVTEGGTIVSKLLFKVLVNRPFFRTFAPLVGLPGSQVTLSGRYLTTTSDILFNGVAAEFSVLSDTTVSAIVPATATSGPITLVTGGGTIVSRLLFAVRVPRPFFRTFTPQQGLPGSQVVLSGRYLTTTTHILFNGIAAAFQVLSDTTVTATVPETAISGPITLVTEGGTIVSKLLYSVLVPPPLFQAFSPKQGLPGSLVMITGQNLATTTAVLFNEEEADFTVLPDGSLEAIVPAAATSGPITLVSPGGTVTSSTSFKLQQPRLHAVYPSQGEPGTKVILFGERLKTTTAVRFNGLEATNVKVHFDFLVTAVVPAGATTGPLEVELAGGGQVTSTTIFQVLGAPAVERVSEPALRKEMAPEASPSRPLAAAPYPNPFSMGITLPLELQAPAFVQLSIYTQTGQLVYQTSTSQLGAGSQQVRWDGRDKQGRPVASGLYFYRLLIDGTLHSGKLLKINAGQ